MLPSGRQAPLLVPDHGGVWPRAGQELPKRLGEKVEFQLAREPEMPATGRKLGTRGCFSGARRLWTGVARCHRLPAAAGMLWVQEEGEVNTAAAKTPGNAADGEME